MLGQICVMSRNLKAIFVYLSLALILNKLLANSYPEVSKLVRPIVCVLKELPSKKGFL